MRKSEYLAQIKERLESALSMPVYGETPKADVLEPFVVLGASTSNSVWAKSGRALANDVQQIDIYVSRNIGRVAAEAILEQAIQAIGRAEDVSTQIVRDNSIGRDVYHIIIRVRNYI